MTIDVAPPTGERVSGLVRLVSLIAIVFDRGERVVHVVAGPLGLAIAIPRLVISVGRGSAPRSPPCIPLRDPAASGRIVIPLEIYDEVVPLRNVDSRGVRCPIPPVVAAKGEIGMCAVHAQPGTANRDHQQDREGALEAGRCCYGAPPDHAHPTVTPTRWIDTAAVGWLWSSRGGSHHTRTSVLPGVAARSYGTEGGVSLSSTVTVPTTGRPTCRAHRGSASRWPVRGHAVAARTAASGRWGCVGVRRSEVLLRPLRCPFTASRRAQGRAAPDCRSKRAAPAKAQMHRCLGCPRTPCALVPRRAHLARSEPAVPATRLVPRVQTVRVPIRNASPDSLTQGPWDRCSFRASRGETTREVAERFRAIVVGGPSILQTCVFPALDAKKLGLWSRRFPASRTPESRGRSLPQRHIESLAWGSDLQAGGGTVRVQSAALLRCTAGHDRYAARCASPDRATAPRPDADRARYAACAGPRSSRIA